MRRILTPMILFASAAYCLVGAGTAALAASASSSTAVKGWRLAAWMLSLGIFGFHLMAERRQNQRASNVAIHVALAVALGAFALAALGPVRAHWNEPSRVKLVILSLAAWPLLTGLPAFVVALIGGRMLDHVEQPRFRA